MVSIYRWADTDTSVISILLQVDISTDPISLWCAKNSISSFPLCCVVKMYSEIAIYSADSLQIHDYRSSWRKDRHFICPTYEIFMGFDSPNQSLLAGNQTFQKHYTVGLYSKKIIESIQPIITWRLSKII